MPLVRRLLDQGSVGDCGLFRLLMFERVSEISGVPATHTVPTLFPDQLFPGCKLIPGFLFNVWKSTSTIQRKRLAKRTRNQGSVPIATGNT